MSKKERWAKVQDPYKKTAIDGSAERKAIVTAGITCRDVTPVYFSRGPYHKAFEERLYIRRYRAYNKRAGGMVFDTKEEVLMFTHVVPSSPAARIRA